MLGVGYQQDLSDDLECDPSLNTALQRLTCDLYYRFGSFLAPIPVIRTISNNYLYMSGVSVVGLAIVGYLLYNKFKKPKQNVIDVPPTFTISNVNTKIEPKRDIF